MRFRPNPTDAWRDEFYNLSRQVGYMGGDYHPDKPSAPDFLESFHKLSNHLQHPDGEGWMDEHRGHYLQQERLEDWEKHWVDEPMEPETQWKPTADQNEYWNAWLKESAYHESEETPDELTLLKKPPQISAELPAPESTQSNSTVTVLVVVGIVAVVGYWLKYGAGKGISSSVPVTGKLTRPEK